MANTPKVKFKTSSALAALASAEQNLSWDNTPAESSNLPPNYGIDLATTAPTNFYKLSDIWLTVAYTTTAATDTLEQYTLFLHETRASNFFYAERISQLNTSLKFELAGGNITGYHLYGYKMSLGAPGDFELLSKKHMFQVTKKVYLNGPLKDNAFLQKKGKYHA